MYITLFDQIKIEHKMKHVSSSETEEAATIKNRKNEQISVEPA